MRLLLAALTLAVPSLALADPPRLTGSWSVTEVTTSDGTMNFPASLAQEDREFVWGRWLWTFADKELTVTSQVLQLDSTATTEKGKRTLTERDYSWCSSAVTVDVGWAGPNLMLPSMVQTEHRSGRYGKRDTELFVESCNVRLNGVQALHLLPGATPDPSGKVVLSSQDGSFKITLVPDKSTVNLKTLIE